MDSLEKKILQDEDVLPSVKRKIKAGKPVKLKVIDEWFVQRAGKIIKKQQMENGNVYSVFVSTVKKYPKAELQKIKDQKKLRVE